jgi:hypothetical protein
LFAVIENGFTTLKGGPKLAGEGAEAIFKQKEKLAKKIETLADFCGLSNRRHLPNALLLKAISNFSCEKRIMHMISNNELIVEHKKFDAYYRQKSAFATTKILDHIKNALSANSIEATISTEESSDSARYDAIVALGRPNEASAWNKDVVRIEIKASLGLDLEQVGRYLWDRSPLILVRVITGQVARIRPSELQSYVAFSLNELSFKIDRLLAQKCHTLPGTDCLDCPNNECTHWRERSSERKTGNIVTLADAEFGQDLTLFFQNLSYVAERTALMVVEELKGFASAKNKLAKPMFIQAEPIPSQNT